MESPGEYLKREREIRGVSLEDISNVTKIRVGLLIAVERNDFDALPATPFVKGFIQAYCRYLGLDAQDAILRHEAYMRSLAENETSALKQTPPPAPYPPLSIIVVAVIAIMVTAGGIYTIISKKQTSPAPESFSDNDPRGQAYSQINHSPIPREHSENEVETKKGEPSLPIKSEGHSDATLNSSVSKTSIGPLTLVIEAAKPAWIKAEIDGQNPFEVSLKEGEKIKWNATERFSLLIGNAGGVNVIFNGKSLGSLGDEGKVIKLILPPDKAGEGSSIKILNP